MSEKNGKNSSMKNPNHINVSNYLIKERVESGEVVSKYCLITDILGGFFTKMLQGEFFRMFRAEIMNITYAINMDKLGMDGTGMKKGFMWKLQNNTDPECPQECVKGCENVSGINED